MKWSISHLRTEGAVTLPASGGKIDEWSKEADPGECINNIDRKGVVPVEKLNFGSVCLSKPLSENVPAGVVPTLLVAQSSD